MGRCFLSANSGRRTGSAPRSLLRNLCTASPTFTQLHRTPLREWRARRTRTTGVSVTNDTVPYGQSDRKRQGHVATVGTCTRVQSHRAEGATKIFHGHQVSTVDGFMVPGPFAFSSRAQPQGANRCRRSAHRQPSEPQPSRPGRGTRPKPELPDAPSTRCRYRPAP